MHILQNKIFYIQTLKFKMRYLLKEKNSSQEKKKKKLNKISLYIKPLKPVTFSKGMPINITTMLLMKSNPHPGYLLL